MKNKFTFLICSERSGSNLITNIFNNHSEFCGPSPTHLLRHFVPLLNKYKDDYKALSDDISEVFNNKIGFWNTNVSAEELKNLVGNSFSEIYDYLYTNEAKYNNKERLFIKENHVYNFIPYILLSFPESKFITLVRDPRDMVLSWKNAKALRGGVIRATDIWLKDQAMAVIFYKNFRPFKRNFIVRYEDLLRNPELILNRCCQLLDCDFESTMLKFFENKVTINNSEEATEWKNISQDLMKNNYNKFKKDLTSDEIKYIEYKCASYMDYLKYGREYDLVDENEFYQIERNLREVEPIEKASYKEINDSEKQKREHLSNILRRINNYDDNFLLY